MRKPLKRFSIDAVKRRGSSFSWLFFHIVGKRRYFRNTTFQQHSNILLVLWVKWLRYAILHHLPIQWLLYFHCQDSRDLFVQSHRYKISLFGILILRKMWFSKRTQRELYKMNVWVNQRNTVSSLKLPKYINIYFKLPLFQLNKYETLVVQRLKVKRANSWNLIQYELSEDR